MFNLHQKSILQFGDKRCSPSATLTNELSRLGLKANWNIMSWLFFSQCFIYLHLSTLFCITIFFFCLHILMANGFEIYSNIRKYVWARYLHFFPFSYFFFVYFTSEHIAEHHNKRERWKHKKEIMALKYFYKLFHIFLFTPLLLLLPTTIYSQIIEYVCFFTEADSFSDTISTYDDEVEWVLTLQFFFCLLPCKRFIKKADWCRKYKKMVFFFNDWLDSALIWMKNLKINVDFDKYWINKLTKRKISSGLFM